MLSRRPMELSRNSDTYEAVVLDIDARLLRPLVFENRAQPGVYEARYVYCGCSDEVVS